jgi:hypothetical protein
MQTPPGACFLASHHVKQPHDAGRGRHPADGEPMTTTKALETSPEIVLLYRRVAEALHAAARENEKLAPASPSRRPTNPDA